MTAQKAVNSLIGQLKPRQRDVVARRFGVGGRGTAEPETLAAIGKKLGLTRERIRQVENAAIASLRKKLRETKPANQLVSDITRVIKSAGGVIGRDRLVQELARRGIVISENHADFLAELSKGFLCRPEDSDSAALYYTDKKSLDAAISFVSGWVNYLNSNKSEILERGCDAAFARFAASKNISKAAAENYVNSCKKIHTNPYGDTGLAEWPEIKPATARDRAYLVLKKNGSPMHFEDIARAINEVKLSVRPALAETIHNELIKDSRFVLVGRGTYGLGEHGYEPGAAKDVIKRVLKKHGPLSTAGVIARVAKERFFKENTIMVNLQNKNFFMRGEDGKYTARES